MASLLFRNANRRVPALFASTALFLTYFGATPAQAQTSFGNINGTITDSTGAAVAGARVRAINTATNVAADTVTSSSGIYNVVSLVPGDYQLLVEHSGFEKSLTNNVVVSVSQTTTVNAQLKIGSVASTVEVSAQADMLTTSSPEVSTTMSTDLLENLPYSESNALEAAMLVPGVRGDPNSFGQVGTENPGIYTGNVAPGAATNMGGGMPGSASVMVDGSNVTQASVGRTSLSVSGNMVEAVTVITNGVPAKYGNTGGGVIIQATRGGTNEYHGNLSWRHTDPPFNAQPLGNTIPAMQHQNFFGMYAGGPVWIPKVYNGKNRTFFYAGYEPARLFNVTSNAARVPTPDELAGKFANAYSLINTTILTQQGLDAALAAPRTGAIYYQSALNPAGFPTGPQFSSSAYVPVPNNDLSAQLKQNKLAQWILSQQPTPQNPGPFIQFFRPDGLWRNDGNNVSLLRGVTNVDNRYSARIDHNIGVKDRMFFRYAAAPITSIRFQGYPLNSPLTMIASDNSWAHNLSFTENHLITPTMFNELKLMYSRNKATRTEAPASLEKDFAAEYGLTPAVAGKGFPKLNWSGYSVSPGVSSISGQTDANYQISDDVTWTKGRHTIAFGADIRRQQSNQYNAGGIYGGTYSFAPNQTNSGSNGGNTIASFILGNISGYTMTPTPVPAYYRWRYYSGYVQDDFKVRPKLTLNFGMRYEFQTPRMEKYDQQGTFIPGLTGTLNGLPAKGAFCFSGNCGLGHSIWPSNYKGFEPRFGIAWAPNQRMTIRANYGMMRVPLTGYGITPLPDFNVNSTSIGGNNGGVNPNQPVDYITNPVVGPFVSALSSLQGSRGPFFTVQGVTIPYIDQTDAVPYIQQWGMTIQLMAAKKTMVQAGYSGTVATHLVSGSAPPQNFPNMDALIGLIKSGANFSTSSIKNPYGIMQNGSVINEGLLASLMPYQNFFNQTLNETFYRQGRSNYHALLVGMSHRMSAGLSLQASFAWSKTIDNAGGSQAVALSGSIHASGTVQNPFDLKQERSVSSFDTPAKLTVGYNYRLPLGKGQMLSAHNRFIDAVIGGWSTSGIFNMQSGMPFVVKAATTGYFVSTGGGTALPSGISLRPDVVAGQPCMDSSWSSDAPFATPFLNLKYFAVPGSLNNPMLGNAPRVLTNCRSPRMASLNGSLVKKINLGRSEKRYLQLQGDFMNATNHPLYYWNPNSGQNAFGSFNTQSITNPTVAPFNYQSNFAVLSQPNSAMMSRMLLVSLKLYF